MGGVETSDEDDKSDYDEYTENRFHEKEKNAANKVTHLDVYYRLGFNC